MDSSPSRMQVAVAFLGYRVSAIQTKEICYELGLGERVDPLVAELDGGGVVTPRFVSLS